MKSLLEILKAFFMALGVIFFVIIIGLTWFFISDPWGIRPLIPSLIGLDKNQVETQGEGSTAPGINPLLTAEQENTLQKLGINPASLPTEITPEMEACFTEKLGAERVKEIMKTGSPSPLDILKAKPCL